MARLTRSATAAVAEDWIQVFGKQPLARDGSRRLRTDVRRALRAASYPALSRARVFLSDGCIVLRGIVPSYHVKQVAQEIAMRVGSVHKVINLLEVRDQARLPERTPISVAPREVV